MRRLLTERYRERLAGVLSCYDRIIVTGTLPGACYAKGMTAFLSAHQIRIFDYPRFAEPLRDRVRERAAELAAAAGVTIEHIAKSHIRKEDLVAKVLSDRGEHPGLVHVISAMEACPTYKPWHSKPTQRTFLRPATGKCLHYYFYFIDPELGLIYLRVPTWCPFRLQFYCNGHSWLARQLTAAVVSPLPTTPLSASTTGRGRRPWPITSLPPPCMTFSIAMPSSAVRCSMSWRRPITGVSCRSSTHRSGVPLASRPQAPL